MEERYIPRNNDLYVVTISLSPEPKHSHESREEYVDRAENKLKKAALPIENAILQAGGASHNKYSWLTSSFLATIPSGQVDAIGKLEGIVSLKQAHKIDQEKQK